MRDLEERQNQLEIRFTYQEQVIEELNGVVIELADRIKSLERENASLKEMLSQLAPEPGVSPDE